MKLLGTVQEQISMVSDVQFACHLKKYLIKIQLDAIPRPIFQPAKELFPELFSCEKWPEEYGMELGSLFKKNLLWAVMVNNYIFYPLAICLNCVSSHWLKLSKSEATVRSMIAIKWTINTPVSDLLFINFGDYEVVHLSLNAIIVSRRSIADGIQPLHSSATNHISKPNAKFWKPVIKQNPGNTQAPDLLFQKVCLLEYLYYFF